MTARSLWSGAISFGLVNVPVKVYTATSPRSVRFHQLSAKTGGRVRQKRVDESTGDEIAYSEIVKGYEITPDRYVTIEPDELDALKAKGTRAIELEKFVPLSSIDPVHYAGTYYLAAEEAGVTAYRLLVSALQETGMVGLGRVVMRGKEHIAAVRVTDSGVLALSTILFGDEVLPGDAYAPEPVELAERQQKMAAMLVNSLAGTFDPSEFVDEYRGKVLELIEAKAAGNALPEPDKETAPAASPDLMAALEASLAQVEAQVTA